ncbi:hypothetical protein [Bradyrhizobium sp. BWA-3-5]|uniref:hypothetical protein n=1 Tax=Bradyrhizobium sp. BWA-3-5 TaxID=3080013 RepID=UPI00293E2C11|nr:hypothetical protein [Bradyrhizobium sp. BWA-3-5]WOH68660.1 hypothetical protein RX331_13530 [Bradyrhizobium sp. BWA-3-5]
MNTSSIYQVETQIGAARERLAALDKEAQDLALPAVSGDQDAVASLAGINAQISQIVADLAVLDRARFTAVEQKREADEARDAERRAHHLQIARDDAAKIIRLSSQADELVDKFDALLVDLLDVDQHLWRALAEAKAQPSDAVVGRRGISQIAVARMREVVDRLNKHVRHQRPVAVVAAVAWSELLKATDDADV